METVAEIQAMRVTDLRNFLSRHNVSVQALSRTDGTPGAPRKADLLRAAMDLVSAHHANIPMERSRPASPDFLVTPTPRDSPPNPFQRNPAPADPRDARRSDVAADNSPAARREPVSRPSDDAATPARAPRRKSINWIDPQLVAALSTPGKAGDSAAAAAERRRQALDDAESAAREDDRVRDRQLQRERDRELLRERELEQERQREAERERQREAERERQREAERERQREAERERQREAEREHQREVEREHQRAAERERQRERRASHAAEAALGRAREHAEAALGPTRRASSGRRMSMFGRVDEEIVGAVLVADDEAPPSYALPETRMEKLRDAQLPEFDPYDADYSDGGTEMEEEELFDARAEEALVKEAEALRRDSRDALRQDGGDLLVQSDYESSGSKAGSDIESLLDSDEEAMAGDFRALTAPQLRGWLTDHKVPYSSTMSKAELTSLAKAHALMVETMKEHERSRSHLGGAGRRSLSRRYGEEERRDMETGQMNAIKEGSRSRMQPDYHEEEEEGEKDLEMMEREEDTIRPISAMAGGYRQSVRRRRIVAPDDDYGNGSSNEDAVALSRNDKLSRRKSGVRSGGRGNLLKPSAAKALVPSLKFNPRTFCLLSIAGVLVLAWWAWQAVASKASMPFCDSESLYVGNETSGCHRCPGLAHCRGGFATCEPGFLLVGLKCVEDQRNSKYAEELAGEIYEMLRITAGYAVCGTVESSKVSMEEMHDHLADAHTKRQDQAFLHWTWRKFEPEKFDVAFDKGWAKVRDEVEDVSVDELGNLSADVPIISFGCSVRLAMWKNLRFVVGTIAILFSIIYVKVRLALKRRHEEILERHRARACELLREHRRMYVAGEEEYACISDVVLREETLGYPTDEVIDLWKEVEARLQRQNLVIYKANRVLNGVPCNTYEWRGRISKGGLMSSGGRSVDGSPGEAVMSPYNVTERKSWLSLDTFKRSLFGR